MASKPNKEEIFDLIQKHPEGLDDDDISKMTGIEPRQEVQQLCNQLASVKRIRRESVAKAGTRGKIHNFPAGSDDLQIDSPPARGASEDGQRRPSARVAAPGRAEPDLRAEPPE